MIMEIHWCKSVHTLDSPLRETDRIVFPDDIWDTADFNGADARNIMAEAAAHGGNFAELLPVVSFPISSPEYCGVCMENHYSAYWLQKCRHTICRKTWAHMNRDWAFNPSSEPKCPYCRTVLMQ